MSDIMLVHKDDELYHYGVKGMKWGHRKAAKNVYKSTKRRAFENYQQKLIDSDDRVNRKIAKLDLNDKKGFKKAVRELRADDKAAEKQYKQKLKSAKSDYKSRIKQDKQLEKATKEHYHKKTQLSTDQKRTRAAIIGAAAVAGLFSPGGIGAIPAAALAGYATTGVMRAQNDGVQMNRGKATVEEILKRF